MKLLKDYIRVYDDVIDEALCQQCISLFEDNKELHQRLENELRPQCTQFNFTKLYQEDKTPTNLYTTYYRQRMWVV